MALRGNLKDFSLPDVFQLVTLSGKTGVLRIKRSDAEGSVWFRDGEVFFAQSDWHAEPLGTRLVSAGRITPSALGRALEVQKGEPANGRRLGAILIAEGYITDKVLEAFVQEQIQDTIFDLFRWDEGDFDFEPLDSAPAEDIGLSVSIENIVMEGSRRLDEWNRIKKKIPSMRIVFKMATAPGEGTFDISLKPTEWSLLLKVDGTRSVAELAREMGRTDFEVARVIYGLFSAGLLEVASDEEVERLRAERAEWEAKYAQQTEKQRATDEREKLEALEREAQLVAEAQARQSAAARAAEAPAPAPAAAAPAAPAEAPAPDHVVEEPAFLTAESPSADDMAVFEQMIGAVLEVPAPAAPEVAETPAAVEPAAPAEVAPSEAPPAPVEEAPAEAAALPEEPEAPDLFMPGLAPDLLEPITAEEPPAPASHPVYEIIEEPEAEVIEEIEVAPAEEAAVAPALAPEPETMVEPEPTPEPEPEPEPAVEVHTLEEVLEAEESVTLPTVPDSEIFGGTEAPPEEGAQELTDLLEALGESVPTTPTEPAPPLVVPEAQPEPPAVAAPEPEPVLEAPQVEPEPPAITGDYAADLMALGLGELPPAEEAPPVEIIPALEEEPETPPVESEAESAAALTELLSSLGDETGEPPVLDTSSVLGEEEPLGAVAQPEASGVISTDAFLADFDSGDVSFSSGLMGDELTALTGGGAAPKRPQATAKKLPEDDGSHVLRRDQHVDRALVQKIIEGVQKL